MITPGRCTVIAFGLCALFSRSRWPASLIPCPSLPVQSTTPVARAVFVILFWTPRALLTRPHARAPARYQPKTIFYCFVFSSDAPMHRRVCPCSYHVISNTRPCGLQKFTLAWGYGFLPCPPAATAAAAPPAGPAVSSSRIVNGTVDDTGNVVAVVHARHALSVARELLVQRVALAALMGVFEDLANQKPGMHWVSTRLLHIAPLRDSTSYLHTFTFVY